MMRMTLKPALCGLILLASLAGCAGPPTQIAIPPVASQVTVRPVVSSLAVRDISLPRYAASGDLVRATAEGIITIPSVVWADTPERAMTLHLADALGQITGARVAAEPWPFSDAPAAEATVRVTRLLGRLGTDGQGQLTLSGSYAIAPVSSSLTNRSGRFDIAVPLRDDTPQALADAYSAAFDDLAETLARRIGR
jgi:hypothetical protein